MRDVEKIGWTHAICWNRTRKFARTDLRSIQLIHIRRALGKVEDSH